MNSNELQIPVPWGIIAAKTCGNPSDPLVLAIHGWADNANSFDPLIPLLPNCYYYVCIDLPGHGRSSPVETSLILHDMDYIIALKLIYNHFKRDKITIVGHSLGGFITLAFAQFYPKCVSKIVIFDVFYFYPSPPHSQFSTLLYNYNQRIKFLSEESKKGPVYTKEEIIKRLMGSRLIPLSRKATEILVDRSIKPAGDEKYRITIAPNVKQIIISSINADNAVDLIQKFPIRCPHLFILSSQSSFTRFAFRRVHNEYKKNSNYEFHIVEGNHEVHLENPGNVAPLVSKFLLKQQHKL